jgi:hypothetical protein
MFILIDRHKLGILAAFSAYIVVFIFLEIITYQTYFPIQPFNDQTTISITTDELLITKENLQVEQDSKNISKDQNDLREQSINNWQENKSDDEISQSIKDYEKSLHQDNVSKNDNIVKENKDDNNDLKPQVSNTNNNIKTAYGGNVMVSWSLTERTAYLNNNWYVRNPGYTCDQDSYGKITIQIKVDQNGSVIYASVLEKGDASQCMINQAIKYAKLSRFNYSITAIPNQIGTITYTFISQ